MTKLKPAEAEYDKLANEYAPTAREYFMILGLAIYHVDRVKLDSAFEISQHDASNKVFEVACKIIKAIYKKGK